MYNLRPMQVPLVLKDVMHPRYSSKSVSREDGRFEL